MSERAMVWFRRDLRVHDNLALHEASERATDGIVAVWVVNPDAWRRHDDGPAKVDFWLRNLRCLADALAARNIPLRVIRVARMEDEADAVVREAAACGCHALYFNREYEIDELRRDRDVVERCASAGLRVHHHDDRVAVAPGRVLTGSKTPYTVFTPFRRAWYAALRERGWQTVPAPKPQPRIDVKATEIPAEVEGFTSPLDASLWPAGEDFAQRRLAHFAEATVRRYETTRDVPAIDGTSALSPYLAAGVVSVRQCITAAVAQNDGAPDVGNEGVVTWVSELAWRDFYQHVMVAFPRVCMYRAFKRETERVPWRTAPAELARWSEGQTGFPLVDAAMRQLVKTGWMHNRLRMLTAMFLTKDLLLDWRAGERFFMHHLVDGDLGANNGGWQWSASTGTDAQPYFRVFNPYAQSKRFDPDGTFIRRFVPELQSVSTTALHDPAKLSVEVRRRVGYALPMVDHNAARVRAITAFKGLSTAEPA